MRRQLGAARTAARRAVSELEKPPSGRRVKAAYSTAGCRRSKHHDLMRHGLAHGGTDVESGEGGPDGHGAVIRYQAEQRPLYPGFEGACHRGELGHSGELLGAAGFGNRSDNAWQHSGLDPVWRPGLGRRRVFRGVRSRPRPRMLPGTERFLLRASSGSGAASRPG